MFKNNGARIIIGEWEGDKGGRNSIIVLSTDSWYRASLVTGVSRPQPPTSQSSSFQIPAPPRSLWSSSHLLRSPRTRLGSCGSRSLSVSGPLTHCPSTFIRNPFYCQKLFETLSFFLSSCSRGLPVPGRGPLCTLSCVYCLRVICVRVRVCMRAWLLICVRLCYCKS